MRTVFLVSLLLVMSASFGFVTRGMVSRGILNSLHMLQESPTPLRAGALPVLVADPWDGVMIEKKRNKKGGKGADRGDEPVIEYTASETLAMAEARHMIRGHMGGVIRCITRDFSAVYRGRFHSASSADPDPGYRLQWKVIRSATTESASKVRKGNLFAQQNQNQNQPKEGAISVEDESMERTQLKYYDDDKYFDSNGRTHLSSPFNSLEDSKRLFLRNRLQNTLKNYEIDEKMFFETLDIHSPDWTLSTFTDDNNNSNNKSRRGPASRLSKDSKEETEKLLLLVSLSALRDSIPLHREPSEIILRLGQLEKEIPACLRSKVSDARELVLKTSPILQRDAENRARASESYEKKQAQFKATKQTRKRYVKSQAASAKLNTINKSASTGTKGVGASKINNQKSQSRKALPEAAARALAKLENDISAASSSRQTILQNLNNELSSLEIKQRANKAAKDALSGEAARPKIRVWAPKPKTIPSFVDEMDTPDGNTHWI